MKKSESKRQATLDVAYLQKQGFESIWVSEITAQVGGSKATRVSPSAPTPD